MGAGGGGISPIINILNPMSGTTDAEKALTIASPQIGAALSSARKFRDVINKPGQMARSETDALVKQQLEFAAQQKSDLEARQKAEAEKLATQQAGLSMQSAKRRQGALAAGAYGRSDTILTGPLGLTSNGPVIRKTLLGA